VFPVVLAVAGTLAITGTSGSLTVPARAAFSGTATAAVRGLDAADVRVKRLVGNDGGFNLLAPAESPTVQKVSITLPAGASLARVATFDADYPEDTDLDMYMYTGGTADLLDFSLGATAEESFTLTEPGTYDVYVVSFSLAPGVPEQDAFTHLFVVGDEVGNLTVNPASQPVTMGQQIEFTAAWNGLTAGTRYLGVIDWGDGSTTVGRTTITARP
jgi:hypothetical protein